MFFLNLGLNLENEFNKWFAEKAAPVKEATADSTVK